MQEIKISEILNMLDRGMKRTEIQEELGISKKELNYIFNHPKLKGKKSKKSIINIQLVDDTNDPVPASVTDDRNDTETVNELVDETTDNLPF